MNCFQLVSLIHHKLSDSIPSVCRDWCSDLRGSTELFCPRLVSGHHVVLHISPYQEQKAGHHCGVFALASSMIEIPQSISCISSLISEVWWNKLITYVIVSVSSSLVLKRDVGHVTTCRSLHLESQLPHVAASSLDRNASLENFSVGKVEKPCDFAWRPRRSAT